MTDNNTPARDEISAIFNKANELYGNEEYEAAYKLIKPLYDLENPRAINFVGSFYAEGHLPFEKDERKAFEHYQEAAEKGSAHGMSFLGQAYFDGIGTESDQQKGIAWWRKAIAAGEEGKGDNDQFSPNWTLYTLAWALRNGYGEKNVEEAISWYKKCKDDVPQAAYELGLIYLFEPGFQQPEAGLQLLREAGEEDAQKIIAAYEKSNEICSQLEQANGKQTRKVLIAELHKCMQSSVEVSDEEQRRKVAEFVASSANHFNPSSVEQRIFYLLLLAHVIYLRDEAPPDEQNICMIVEILEAGKTDWGESDATRLYNLLRKKNPDHPALTLYDQHLALAGPYASQLAVKCKKALFREVGSVDDVFEDIYSFDDAELLADVLSYSFHPEKYEDWASSLVNFRSDLAACRMRLGRKGVKYEDLLKLELKPFSEAVLKTCNKFYNEFK